MVNITFLSLKGLKFSPNSTKKVLQNEKKTKSVIKAVFLILNSAMKKMWKDYADF